MDEVLLFDGRGREAKGVITRLDREHFTVEIKEVYKSSGKESALGIRLLQGILKGQKMDLVIQKTAELGVARIQPLVTKYTEVKITRKLERWQKIAIEAARQCGRNVAPVINEPVEFMDFFKSGPVAEENGLIKEPGIIFWERGGEGLKEIAARLQDADSRFKGTGCISLAVGPEGGFSEEEVSVAVNNGFYRAGLGPRILRAETAAITAVGLAQFLFGDMG